jgi:hypothetical protein
MAVGDEKEGSAVAAKDASRTSRGSSDLEEIEKDNEKTQMGQAPLAGMDMDPTGGLKELNALREVAITQIGKVVGNTDALNS